MLCDSFCVYTINICYRKSNLLGRALFFLQQTLSANEMCNQEELLYLYVCVIDLAVFSSILLSEF